MATFLSLSVCLSLSISLSLSLYIYIYIYNVFIKLQTSFLLSFFKFFFFKWLQKLEKLLNPGWQS